MGATASLSQSVVEVLPGGRATVEVRVRNTGTVVDQFTIDVVGEAAAWSASEPPSLSLFPGAEGSATVTFRPPRAADVRTGALSFGVRVASREDPTGSTVEEGTLQIGGFADSFGELIPRTARGRRAARFELALDNRGNTRFNSAFSAVDPDELLTFEFDPPGLPVEPGTAAFAKLKAKPRKRFLRGQPKTLPFQVFATHDEADGVTIDGTMVQEPLIPRWLPRALLGLLAILLLLVILWFALLKPTVESAAKDAVEEPLSRQAAQIAALEQKTTGTTTPGSEEAPPESGGFGGLGEPFDRRLSLNVPAGSSGADEYTVPSDRVVSLTDIVLGNPGGDAGRLVIRRNDSVLLVVELANFRDLDYHFVSPIQFRADQRIVLEVSCADPNPGGPTCTPSAYLTGFVRATD